MQFQTLSDFSPLWKFGNFSPQDFLFSFHFRLPYLPFPSPSQNHKYYVLYIVKLFCCAHSLHAVLESLVGYGQAESVTMKKLCLQNDHPKWFCSENWALCFLGLYQSTHSTKIRKNTDLVWTSGLLEFHKVKVFEQGPGKESSFFYQKLL